MSTVKMAAWSEILPGDWVEITGGMLADPQGRGIDPGGVAHGSKDPYGGGLYDFPGPVPSSIVGSHARVVGWDGEVITVRQGGYSPFPEERAAQIAAQARPRPDFVVLEVIDGPLAGKLISAEMATWRKLHALEILALQAPE